jgi:hypothetical protein
METNVSTWDRISEALAQDLRASLGDPGRERASLARALAAYARAHVAAGAPSFEHAMHFFAVDGHVLGTAIIPAFARLEVDRAAIARWTDALAALPRRLDQLDDIGSSRSAVAES